MTNLNWQDLPRKSTIKCGAGIYSERFRATDSATYRGYFGAEVDPTSAHLTPRMWISKKPGGKPLAVHDQAEQVGIPGEWTREVQVEFNRFIRARDANQPCISCGRQSGAKRNAGHYRPVGACPELRFCEINCHVQCEHCNSYNSGNLSLYRPA